MECYLGDPAATSHALEGGFLKTGDLGYTRDGELFWVGRLDDRITVRGRKIDPSCFEAPLLDVEGLRKGCFVAFGVDNAATGSQRVVVVAELARDNVRPAADIERDVLGRLLVDFGLTDVEILLAQPHSLDKTSSGKRRHAPYRRSYQAGSLRLEPPRTEPDVPVATE